MRLIEDHILRKVHGDVVLLPFSNKETDFKGMIVLNHSAEILCRMLEQDVGENQLVTGLVEEYDVDAEKARKDVEAFLAELDSCHMLLR